MQCSRLFSQDGQLYLLSYFLFLWSRMLLSVHAKRARTNANSQGVGINPLMMGVNPLTAALMMNNNNMAGMNNMMRNQAAGFSDDEDEEVPMQLQQQLWSLA